MANIINEMNLSEKRIKLDIYTPDYNNRAATSLNNLRGVSVIKTVAYKEMPKLLASYDLLFLPLDFDKDGIRFAKLSMPTKTSEYMISGTPILIYSPKETAVAKFFSQNNCGYCVTHQSKEEIKKAIGFLTSDEEYRQKISRNAVKLAVERFDSVKVRERFRDILMKASINKVI
jgi:glycosyltransferase involved in cell wall biosynthesis